LFSHARTALSRPAAGAHRAAEGTVALDGCRLVLIGGMTRQGTPALAALLTPKGR
jgi:hypothetical protein